MEVRCGSCNKVFRVSEDKITGSGIKFACSKCGNPVTITREESEQYFQLNKTAPASPPVVQQPLKMDVRCSSCGKSFRISEDKITGPGIKFACSKCGAPITISKEDLENYKRNLQTAMPWLRKHRTLHLLLHLNRLRRHRRLMERRSPGCHYLIQSPLAAAAEQAKRQ
jgi:predicted Zn finger-like uncharacterized protein